MGDFVVWILYLRMIKKKSFEGRRYQKDMQHSHEALSLFNKGLGKHKARKIMFW